MLIPLFGYVFNFDITFVNLEFLSILLLYFIFAQVESNFIYGF